MYKWAFGDTKTSTKPNPTNTYNTANNFNITLESTSDKGCKTTLSKSIDIYPMPYTIQKSGPIALFSNKWANGTKYFGL